MKHYEIEDSNIALQLKNSKVTGLTVDILVPSNRDVNEVKCLLDNIKEFRSIPGQLIFTGEDVSAARNRNIALKKAKSEIVIMLDDDITGFFPGWDLCLISPFLVVNNINIISARLMNQDGTLGNMTGNSEDSTSFIAEVNRVPSACIALKKDDIYFDEKYIGSGFEDTDFCMARKNKYSDSIFAINNYCRLIHLNAMQNQVINFRTNREYYEGKWGALEK
jgi:hypothetical protein